MRAYCPHCRTGRPLPPYAKAGLTVYCQACRKPFVLSDATVPGLKKSSLPLYNLLTLIILAGLGYAAWYYYPKLVGRPQGVIESQSIHTVFDKVFVECTVRNKGRTGIIQVAPTLVLTGDRTKPYPGLGSLNVTLKSGESRTLQFQWVLAPGEAANVVKVTFKVTGR